MWAVIFQLVLSYAIAYVTAPKPKNAKAAVLSEFDFPQIDESTPQEWIFGDCWTDGWFVLGIGNFRTIAIKK